MGIRRMNKLLKFIISIIICQLAGIIGSIFTVSSVNSWYLTLVKPSFNPPSWVFSPVWITLFVLMGISLYLIWEAKDNKKTMILFYVQLVLNILWSIMFFGLKNPLLAFIEIIILWIFILMTIIYSYRISRPAAYLLAPYILWVTFAAVLNFMIYWLN